MSARLRTLAARRDALIVEAQAQRAALAEASVAIRKVAATGDRVVGFVERMKRKPLLIGIAATALSAVLRARGGAFKWLSLGLSSYSLLQKILLIVSPFGRRG